MRQGLRDTDGERFVAIHEGYDFSAEFVNCKAEWSMSKQLV
jgi:hypothetical protein